MQTEHSKKAKNSLFQEELDLSLLNEEDLREFFNMEEDCLFCLRFFQEKEILENPNEFAKEVEQEAFESSYSLPLPKYLQNYMEMSLGKSPEKNQNSLVVKLAQDGLKLLGSLLNTNFKVLPSFEIAVRSKEAELTQTINLEEQESSYEIHYQIIRENEKEVYLSIHFPKNKKIPYDQVVLRKNNRFIYSSQIGEKGIVSFSGLQEGRYVVEFLGRKSSKSIDITILLDHP